MKKMKIKTKENIFSSFKKWYELARPSTRIFMVTLITASIPCVLAILEPIAAANVITALAKLDYMKATLWLVIGFGFLFGGALSWHVNYWNYSRLLGDVYIKINLKMYDKIMNAQDSNFKTTSKEKIINTIGSDIYTVGNFSDAIATKTSYFLRVVVTLIIIFVSSYWAGIIVVGINILNFFLLQKLNRKIAVTLREVAESKDAIFERMTNITDGRYFLSDFGLREKAREAYRESCNKYVVGKHKNSMQYSYIDNWVYVLWKFIVMLLSIYFVWLIEGGGLSLTIYLIIVSYVGSGIELTNKFFMVFLDLQVATVARVRVETILNFSEKELVEYGENLNDAIEGSISFIQVTVRPSEKHDPSINAINNISFNIKKGELVLILGQRSCGKRTIFHILRRALTPDSGKVMLGGADLFEFSPEVHKSNIVYTTHKPYFFNGSIMENLNMIDHSKKRAIEMCKQVGIHDFIMKLKDKYDTDINQNKELFSDQQRYLISLARALLTRAEVVMVYEFPTQLAADERIRLVELFKSFKGKKTIIVFSANEDVLGAATSVYSMSRGKLIKSK